MADGCVMYASLLSEDCCSEEAFPAYRDGRARGSSKQQKPRTMIGSIEVTIKEVLVEDLYCCLPAVDHYQQVRTPIKVA